MLTEEVLRANKALEELAPEAISTIVEMSKNDENNVIAAKTREIYNRIDGDLKTSGIEKNHPEEKTYDYAKRVIETLKSKSENSQELSSKIAMLEEEKARLENVIKTSGSDEETKTLLSNTKAELDQTKNLFNALNEEKQKLEETHKKELFGLKVEFEISEAEKAMKYKKEIPEAAKKELVRQVISKVKGYNPDFIDNGEGGKQLVFRTNEGATMNNPENGLKPYSVSEILAKELEIIGILDKGRVVKGAGGNGGHITAADPQPTVEISGAKSRDEVTDIIHGILSQKGFLRENPEYQTEFNKIYKENENHIKTLPLK
ncbi:MAG: hypothetical protein LBP67_05020 [Bacteroidales bacterium]|jgi:hypothetical protein|nr:hypothetical protein [Bacteroidales bacterium]